MLPARDQSADSHLPDALDAGAAVAFLVVAALSWTALTLAEFGAFTRPVFVVCATLVGAGLVVWLRPVFRWIRTEAGLLVLCVACCALARERGDAAAPA